MVKKTALGAFGLAVVLSAAPAMAQKSYGPGVTDKVIKIGNTAPYSGPVSAASTVAKSIAAYFDMVNAEGGINGRKIEFISLDDGYSPPKTVEATRRLVESDHVLLTLGSVGTPPQLAVRKYLNDHKVPQLFIASGASAFFEPKISPYSMGGSTSYRSEGRLMVKYLAQVVPHARIAVLYQNDDFGKDFLRGAKEAMPAGLKIVAEASFETSDPTVDSQILTLKASGANAFLLLATQKAAAQAIRRAHDVEWKPKIVMPGVIASIAAVFRPAGIANSIGVTAATIAKDTTDPRLKNDPAVMAYLDWFRKYNTKVDVHDSQAATGGYIDGKMMAMVLKECGDNLTRENVMRHVRNIHDVTLPIFLPGISANTSPTNYNIYRKLQFESFNGTSWDLFGKVVSE